MSSYLEDFIKAAILEDLPSGDITTESLENTSARARGLLVAKSDVILSGAELFQKTFLQLNHEIQFKWFFQEGNEVLKNQTICQIKGLFVDLLRGERVALNFLSHLSGIATLTHKYVEKIRSTRTKILDTRKTLPLYRQLEKLAVKHGGGENHRISLSDQVLIKENHIALAGSLAQAVAQVRKKNTGPVEVEVRTLDEVQQAVDANCDRLLLDNMDNETIKKALKIIPPSIETEASGNMTLDRVESVAKLGVDFISVGAITHSAPAADLSLMIERTDG